MHVLFFVEEPSVEITLGNLAPKILPAQASFQFIVFQGKRDLLNNLTPRLLAYSS